MAIFRAISRTTCLALLLSGQALSTGSAGGEDALPVDAAESSLVYAYEQFLAAHPDHALGTEVWLKLANIHLRNRRFDSARQGYEQVIGRSQAADEVEMKQAGQLGMGLAYSGEKRYQDAWRELDSAIREAEGLPRRGNLVSMYREMASIGLQLRNYTSVIEYGTTARDAYRTLGRWEDEAVMLLVIGVASAETGDIEQAAGALQRSHQLFRERADDPGHREQATRVARIARGYGIDDVTWTVSRTGK